MMKNLNTKMPILSKRKNTDAKNHVLNNANTTHKER